MVIPVNAAIGKECAQVEFMSSASRGSGKEGLSKSAKCTTVDVRTVDSIVTDEKIDLIKLDVEGDEADAIEGCRKTMARCAPSMAVSVYHRTQDIFELPLLLGKLLPDHKMYLRREECIPAWDITLFCVKK